MIFTKVFKATGTKNGRTWTRWDYKTAEGERYVHFADTAEIPLDTAVNAETNGDGLIQVWSRVEGNTQSEPRNGSEGQRTAPVASQGPSTRDTQIHRQTAAKVASKLLDYFPVDEQSLDTFFVLSEKLVDYFQNGARDEVPF